MPQSAPFGLAEVAFTIVLLLLTNAWVLLVIPLDWQHTFVGRMNFDRAVCFILVWWTIFLGASVFAISNQPQKPPGARSMASARAAYHACVPIT